MCACHHSEEEDVCMLSWQNASNAGEDGRHMFRRKKN